MTRTEIATKSHALALTLAHRLRELSDCMKNAEEAVPAGPRRKYWGEHVFGTLCIAASVHSGLDEVDLRDAVFSRLTLAWLMTCLGSVSESRAVIYSMKEECRWDDRQRFAAFDQAHLLATNAVHDVRGLMVMYGDHLVAAD